MKTIGPVAAIVAAVLAPLGMVHAAPTETVLHSFGHGGGKYPVGGLIFDAAGNLYGTTSTDGRDGFGKVFELTPPAAGQTAWTETVLHRFNGTDGAYPAAGLIFDAAGNLYGTTYAGGNMSTCGGVGCGTVFELTPPAAGQAARHETVLHRFKGTDGFDPRADLIFDAAGNLYGTTGYGGAQGYGTVFELRPPAAGQTTWIEMVLHSFIGTDGASPYLGLIFDAAGNLYGTTVQGGNLSACGGSGCGAVFEVTP